MKKSACGGERTSETLRNYAGLELRNGSESHGFGDTVARGDGNHLAEVIDAGDLLDGPAGRGINGGKQVVHRAVAPDGDMTVADVPGAGFIVSAGANDRAGVIDEACAA